jgi:hypothetical protein
MSAPTNSTSHDHATHASRLKRRHAELSAEFDRAHDAEIAAIRAAAKPAASAGDARQRDREMKRALGATSAISDAILAIESQQRRVDLDLVKAANARADQETRRAERAKREAIRTAMAEDRRFAAIEQQDAKLAAISGEPIVKPASAPPSVRVNPQPGATAVADAAGAGGAAGAADARAASPQSRTG